MEDFARSLKSTLSFPNVSLCCCLASFDQVEESGQS